jgi:hypothetical protein
VITSVNSKVCQEVISWGEVGFLAVFAAGNASRYIGLEHDVLTVANFFICVIYSVIIVRRMRRNIRNDCSAFPRQDIVRLLLTMVLSCLSIVILFRRFLL